MNRTTLIITIGIIIAVCTGIYLYTEWEKARFDASLPKPPTDEEQHVADDNTRGHWHNGEWHAEPHPEPADERNPEEPLVEVAPRVVPRLPTLEEVQEELRAIVARPLPPNADELDREKRALTEETIMLNEKAHTLSEAEFIKRSKDLLERQLDWDKRSSKRSRERLAAIRQAAEAKRARARSNRGDN